MFRSGMVFRGGDGVKILDLFCGAGGAAMGLHRAGFEIVGVDINPQPNYPFEFIQADVLEIDLDGYDAYWSSPPCQCYSFAARRWRNNGINYPDLIKRTRKRLLDSGKPFIIENVVGAPLRKDLILCGEMFGLNVIRHRIFEFSHFRVPQPKHKNHKGLVRDGYYVTVAGHGGNDSKHNYCHLNCLPSKTSKLKVWQHAMGIDWMTKQELTQAVPPAYSEYIGEYLAEQIARTGF